MLEKYILVVNLKCNENQICKDFKCVENPKRHGSSILIGGVTLFVISGTVFYLTRKE